MEYIIIAGQFIKWVLVMMILMVLFGTLESSRISIIETEDSYGSKTTIINW